MFDGKSSVTPYMQMNGPIWQVLIQH